MRNGVNLGAAFERLKADMRPDTFRAKFVSRIRDTYVRAGHPWHIADNMAKTRYEEIHGTNKKGGENADH